MWNRYVHFRDIDYVHHLHVKMDTFRAILNTFEVELNFFSNQTGVFKTKQDILCEGEKKISGKIWLIHVWHLHR